MIQAIKNLSSVFQWRKIHGGITKQASGLPSKTNFQKSAQKWQFPLNDSNKTQYGALPDIARKMSLNDYCVCPNRSKANALRHQIVQHHGAKSCKTKTLDDGTVRVERV